MSLVAFKIAACAVKREFERWSDDFLRANGDANNAKEILALENEALGTALSQAETVLCQFEELSATAAPAAAAEAGPILEPEAPSFAAPIREPETPSFAAPILERAAPSFSAPVREPSAPFTEPSAPLSHSQHHQHIEIAERPQLDGHLTNWADVPARCDARELPMVSHVSFCAEGASMSRDSSFFRGTTWMGGSQVPQAPQLRMLAGGPGHFAEPSQKRVRLDATFDQRPRPQQHANVSSLNAKQKSWFATLPPNQFTDDEERLRTTLLEFLGSWRGRALPSMGDLGNGAPGSVAKSVLPKSVSISKWVEQRLGNDVVCTRDGANLFFHKFGEAGPCPNGGKGGGQGVMTSGDWRCPKCGDHVFARNNTCRRCGSERP